MQKIPELFKIDYDGLNYFIYSSTDILKCFVCNLEGHVAKNCTNYEQNTNPPQTHTQIPNTPTNQHTVNINIPTNVNQDNSQEVNTIQCAMEVIPGDNKRPHSQISSTETQIELKLDDRKFITVASKEHKRKLVKTEPPTSSMKAPEEEDDLDKKLKSIKDYLNKGNVLLNYAQFKSLLGNTKSVQNPLTIIQNYTNDIEAFTKFIQEDVYCNVRNTGIKQRCTRLLNKIKDPISNQPPLVTPLNSEDEQD